MVIVAWGNIPWEHAGALRTSVTQMEGPLAKSERFISFAQSLPNPVDQSIKSFRTGQDHAAAQRESPPSFV